MDNSGHITRLSGEECRLLLREHSIGRVAWLSPAGLQVLPVSYAVDGEMILFRTAPESVLAALADGGVPVSFEVDDIDVVTATGWSVLVRGEAGVGPAEPRVAPRPWAPGGRPLTIAITPSAYSGRAVSADQ